MKNYLAIDIGASSGRHILGTVKDGQICLEEIYRFDNGQVRRNGHDCWDVEKLVESVKAGIDEAISKYEIESIGIDTWGVDFVLLDDRGEPCSDAVAYRDDRTKNADIEIEAQILPFVDLYSRTGIQKASYNTIYQLWALKKESPDQLEKASHFLMMPEYLNYRLTGNIVHEYTDSSTTALLDAVKKDWDFDLIEKLGLPKRIFGKLEMPGAVVGEYKGVKVVLPAMHDTASAYLAVPARDDKAVYLSSGTWSLLGVENTSPITTSESCEANFTNEGGAWGRYRYLKNIMGLWMIQSIRRELNQVEYVEGKGGDAKKEALLKISDYEQGRKYSFAELEMMARGAAEYNVTIDVNEQRFMNPESMIGEVLAAAAAEGEAPSTIGELMQCVYNSLAECYAAAISTLSFITGKTYTSINIVGGGSKDKYLNALTAEATGLEVFAGPTEGTAIGNLIVQMIAGGEFSDLEEARKAIAR
ncbi:MAG: rhamnulokinase [Kiritimatiellae bacterium]|nr:rhamnulokinase [Kiritimatiellia bacterium]MBR3776809.1 rhamnulokinase [Kiritimatiellia bacterium]